MANTALSMRSFHLWNYDFNMDQHGCFLLVDNSGDCKSIKKTVLKTSYAKIIYNYILYQF